MYFLRNYYVLALFFFFVLIKMSNNNKHCKFYLSAHQNFEHFLTQQINPTQERREIISMDWLKGITMKVNNSTYLLCILVTISGYYILYCAFWTVTPLFYSLPHSHIHRLTKSSIGETNGIIFDNK